MAGPLENIKTGPALMSHLACLNHAGLILLLTLCSQPQLWAGFDGSVLDWVRCCCGPSPHSSPWQHAAGTQ